jgi:hypothetical protein
MCGVCLNAKDNELPWNGDLQSSYKVEAGGRKKAALLTARQPGNELAPRGSIN